MKWPFGLFEKKKVKKMKMKEPIILKDSITNSGKEKLIFCPECGKGTPIPNTNSCYNCGARLK